MLKKSDRRIHWNDRRVLVTGGASFIGSHLVDLLVEYGADVSVVDDLSSGRLDNIKSHIKSRTVRFIKGNLLNQALTEKACKNQSVVFHLAADHGGRGYVDLHQAACATNLALDGMVFLACRKAGVERIIYASSGCVYPNFLQMDIRKKIFLKENLVVPPYDADNMYGWAKLMAELTLQAYSKEYGIKTASCRFFTVYGERGVENHAVIAMIARAFVRQNPFEVWGDGTQIRNWTYVKDIVRGMFLTAETIGDGTAVNLGTMERTRVIDAVHEVLRCMNHHPKIKFRPDMPTGPLNRVADNALAKKLMNWEPQVKFMDGLHRTIDWYVATKNRKEVKRYLSRQLTER